MAFEQDNRVKNEINKFVDDGSGNPSIRTTATISGDVNVDNTSLSTDGLVGKASGTNADFTTAYAGGTTFTCSTLPTGVSSITADDIVSIQQIATAGSVTNTYTRDDVTITASGTDPTTITVTGATFVATDTFIVHTNIPRATINDSVYSEDSAHTTGDTGNFILGVRNDGAAATLTNTDGDYSPIAVNASGKVFITSSHAEDAAHSSGDQGSFMLAVRNDAGTSLVDTDGDYAPLQVNAFGMLNVNYDMIRDVAPDVNTGALSAGTPRMTLATDDPAVTSLAIVDDWDAVEDAAIGTDGAVIMAKARNTQQAAVAEDDAIIPVTNLYGELKIAGHDSATNSNRVEETDPISSHHVEETLAAVTNGTDGTYYYYFDMDGSKHFTTQLTLSGGSGTCTVTCEATLQDDGTAPASCTYVDITSALFGAASFTASDMLIGDQNYGFKYIRYKVVAATGAADDADWTIYNKKLY